MSQKCRGRIKLRSSNSASHFNPSHPVGSSHSKYHKRSLLLHGEEISKIPSPQFPPESTNNYCVILPSIFQGPLPLTAFFRSIFLSCQVSTFSLMDSHNQTQEMEFVFLAFSIFQRHHVHFFLVFLAAYLVTLLGNFMIITLVLLDSRLHTPMYFFLSQLSCLDICLSSVVVPKILVNLIHQQHTTSYDQCLAQAFFLIGFAGCEPALLAVMAYDRYAAICQPLHYAHMMRSKLCIELSVAIWFWGFLDSTIYAALVSKLDFCGNHQILHMWCDVPPLLKIACSDTQVNKLANHITSFLVGLGPFLFIILSYFCILASIVWIPSNTGRCKAFSTCASHIAVVTLYIGNGFLNYNQPGSGYSLESDTLISIMFCIVTPMLNPLIYSLRNKEVKEARRKVFNSWTAAFASF